MQNTSANSSIQEDKIVKHFRAPQIGSFMHYYFYTTFLSSVLFFGPKWAKYEVIYFIQIIITQKSGYP